MPLRFVALALACLVLGTQPLAAQKEQNREGFWISLGIGGGSLGASCDGCEDIDRQFGLAGNLRLGMAVSPNILVGAEVTGWAFQWIEEDGTTYLRTSFLGAVTFYPITTGGLFLAVGAGYTMYRETIDGLDGERTANGLGGMARVGYDLRVGKNFSVSPYGEFEMTFGGALKVDGTDMDTSANTNVVNLGLAVTFH